MKNKYRIGLITFFVTMSLCVIFLNIFSSASYKNYNFKRLYSSAYPLVLQSINGKMNENEYVMSVDSDSLIVERDIKNIDKNIDKYIFYINDFEFKEIKTMSVILPIDAKILNFNTKNIYFTNHLKTYFYNLKSEGNFKPILNGIKLKTIKKIPNSTNKFLCLAEVQSRNSFKTGFYIVDFDSGTVALSKNIDTNTTTTFSQNSLKYSGMFVYNFEQNKIIYCCNKFSKIFFFDKEGLFIKDFQTADNTPLPGILTNSQGLSFYERGKTSYCNMAVIMKNNRVFVFSNATDNRFRLFLDEYSFSAGNYLRSFKLNYNNQNAGNIRKVFMGKNKIILGFEFNYASFIFSRYI